MKPRVKQRIHTRGTWRAVNSISLQKQHPSGGEKAPEANSYTAHGFSHKRAILNTYRCCRPRPVATTCPGRRAPSAPRRAGSSSAARRLVEREAAAPSRRRGAVQSEAACRGGMQPIKVGKEERERERSEDAAALFNGD